jgi:cyclohexyl-isocyanide hydratase
MSELRTNIGLLLFPGFTQLDLTGPYEVLARIPDTAVHLVAKTADPVRSERGLTILPTHTLESAPPLDLLCVPGGHGIDLLLPDERVLDYVRRQAETARYVTSVCTGALLLGAAGLLRGYRATTHWTALELLAQFGALPVDARVVVDQDRITGAGVTAGIDFALTLAAILRGEEVAREIQLMLQYEPAPPFASGSPRAAGPATVARVQAARTAVQAERERRVREAAARLAERGPR